jgi:hypothetical protein
VRMRDVKRRASPQVDEPLSGLVLRPADIAFA